MLKKTVWCSSGGTNFSRTGKGEGWKRISIGDRSVLCKGSFKDCGEYYRSWAITQWAYQPLIPDAKCTSLDFALHNTGDTTW